MQYYLSFDVESIGLFGPPFAVAWVVVDENGEEHYMGYLGTDPYTLLEQNSTDFLWAFSNSDLEWVEDNVIPALPKDYNCESLPRLVTIFWKWWEKFKKEFPGIMMVTDTPFPVESGFLRYCCLTKNLDINESPYPVIDVGSVLLAHGYDPLDTYKRLPNELPAHSPLADCRQSVRLMLAVINGEPID